MKNQQESAALATREEMTEVSPTRLAAEAKYMVESAITIALRFPRNEDKAFATLMRACTRPNFAEQTQYTYPRGGDKDCSHEWAQSRCKHCNAVLVTGPSVYLAREALRIWGNAWADIEVVTDAETCRVVLAWAWDLQTNVRRGFQRQFEKVIYRRGKGWIVPDERELQELTSRNAAIAERNAIFRLLPRDLIDDALEMSQQTVTDRAAKDPDAERKKILIAFQRLNVTPEMLQTYLGHKVQESSPHELTQLRAIWKSIEDGNSRWSEYCKPPATQPAASVAQPAGPPPAEPKAAKRAAKAAEAPCTAIPAPPAAAAPPAPASSGVSPHATISGPQLNLFWLVAKKNGWTEAQVHQELGTQFGIEHVHHIPRTVFDEILSYFSKPPGGQA